MLCTLGVKVKVLRRGRGLTQQELADAVGVHVSSISKLERGVPSSEGGRGPRLDTMRRLAVALDTDVDDLLQALESHRAK